MITIPPKNVTRHYELTYLVPVALTETELATVKEEVSALVTKYKGSVESTDDWGKKRMAYSIKKNKVNHREAYYIHTVISLPAENVSEFDRNIRLHEHLIRHLLVIADDSVQAETEEA